MQTPEPAAAENQDWAVFVGDKLVTQYETKDEAAEAMAWYLDTYGAPSEPLTIGPVRDGE